MYYYSYSATKVYVVLMQGYKHLFILHFLGKNMKECLGGNGTLLPPQFVDQIQLITGEKGLTIVVYIFILPT